MTTTQESAINSQPLSASEERAIRDALALMTPGPWHALLGEPLWSDSGVLYNENDAAGIVTIRNNAPRLLATITALRDRVTQEASAVSAWQQKHSAVSGQIRARDAWVDDLVRRFASEDASGSFLSKEVRVERAFRVKVERIAFLEKTRDELQAANTREVEARRAAEARNQELTDELGDWQNRMSVARAEAHQERDRVVGLTATSKMLSESNAELTRRLAIARTGLQAVADLKPRQPELLRVCALCHRSESEPNLPAVCMAATTTAATHFWVNRDARTLVDDEAPTRASAEEVRPRPEIDNEADVSATVAELSGVDQPQPFMTEEARSQAMLAARVQSDEDPGGMMLKIATEHERTSLTLRRYAEMHEWFRRFASFAPNAAQLLDGWHADGTAWSEWDESVRRELSALQAASDRWTR